MCPAHKHIGRHILGTSVHARNTAAAPALGTVELHLLALHITKVCHGDHAVLIGDQILDIHLTAHGLDLCTPLIRKLGTDGVQLGLDDAQQSLAVAEDILVIGDLDDKSSQLFFDLLPFQTGKLS